MEESARQLIKELEKFGILDAMGDGVSIQDTEFRVIYQNQVHKNIIGDHQGEYCYRVYECREAVCEGCPVEMSFRDGGIHTTVRSAPTDRGVVYVEVTASPLRDRAGNIIAGIEVVRDITEHRRMDELLRKASTEWRHTFDSIPDFISVHDKDFKFVKVNKSLADFLGARPEELVGKHCYEVLHDKAVAWPGCPHEKMLSLQKTMTLEVMDPRIGRPLLVTVSPMFDEKGELIGGIHIARDITERKKMEEKLKVMDWAIKSSLNAIVLADLEGNLTYVNPSFLKMWGYESDSEVTGTSCTKFWEEEKKGTEILEALRDKGEWTGERVALRKDGTTFIAELSANMVRDDDGKPICMMASLVDITERKKMEKEVEERVKELEEFYEMAVSREIRMKELKSEVQRLKAELSRFK